MSEFQALLDDLDALQKAHAAATAEGADPLLKAAKRGDDAAIQAAADGDADDDGIDDGDEALYEPDGDEGDDEDGDEDEDEEYDDAKDRMGKAFSVTLADGTEVDAFDGTEMIAELRGQLRDAAKVMAGQQALIKSLSGEVHTLARRVEAFGAKPAGRKSVLNIHDKPSAVAQPKADISPRTILAKALGAQREGKLHGGQVAEIEAYLNRGSALPEHLSRWLD